MPYLCFGGWPQSINTAFFKIATGNRFPSKVIDYIVILETIGTALIASLAHSDLSSPFGIFHHMTHSCLLARNDLTEEPLGILLIVQAAPAVSLLCDTSRYMRYDAAGSDFVFTLSTGAGAAMKTHLELAIGDFGRDNLFAQNYCDGYGRGMDAAFALRWGHPLNTVATGLMEEAINILCRYSNGAIALDDTVWSMVRHQVANVYISQIGNKEFAVLATLGGTNFDFHNKPQR
jgi:hypothetical protein